VRDTIGIDGVLQSSGDGFLPHDLAEVLRAISASEYGVRHEWMLAGTRAAGLIASNVLRSTKDRRPDEKGMGSGGSELKNPGD
jgi:hypothetical protein